MALKKKEIKKKIKNQRIKSEKTGPGVHKIKIKIIGIGGGASSIVSDIAAAHKGTSYLVADTDTSNLAKLKRKKAIKIFHFGEDLTLGMGTGMSVEVGQRAAEEAKERIVKALEGYDLCIFVVCLGGGTGSGAISIFAEASKQLKNINYGIFTLPFGFEREKKMEIAKETLKRLEPLLNAITIVPNERIFKIVDRKVPLKNALSSINKELGFSLSGLIEMIYNPGVINIDFADIKTILTGRKPLAYLTRVYKDNKEEAKEILQELLQNPLYPYNISRANRLLFNIVGPASLPLSQVAQISEGVSAAARKSLKVVFGVESAIKRKGIDITLLAVGCELDELFSDKKNKKRAGTKTKERKAEEKAKINFKSVKGKKRVFKKAAKKNRNTRKEEEMGSSGKRAAEKKPFLEEKSEKKIKVRKNALQLQKDMKEIEKEILEKEEAWETPAFLRQETDPAV